MSILPFGSFRPDVTDYEGQDSADILNVVPRGDGYGPFNALAAATGALPSQCRGLFFARKNDGSIQVFGGTSTDLFTLNNTTQVWTPASKVAALTSISNASPAVFTLVGHGLSIGDPIVLSTSGSLPTGLTVGTIYYVIAAGFSANAFEVSTTPGGSAVNTSSAGSGTHSYTAHYAAIASTAQWQFVQFNNFVIAVHVNVPPQVFDLRTDSAFTALGGSPPQAAYISVVNRFVVLSGLSTTDGVYTVRWSGLNATTTWTSGVNQSDSQVLPDGGIVRGVTGGDSGLVFQDSAIRRLTYAPGSPYIFGIDRIATDDGLFAPYSLISAADRVFYLSPQGFKMLLPGGYPTPIGKEKVDRTVLAEIDSSNLQLMLGASDPTHTRVFWAYKTRSSSASAFDRIIVYDWMLERWAIVRASGEFITSLATPGLTLEGLDTAYGTNIDTIALGSLDDISISSQVRLAGVDTTHKMGFFSGGSLEAIMETSEHGGDGRRIYVRGYRPVTDATSIFGSVSQRENLQAAPTYTSESQVNGIGKIDTRVSTRYARGKVRIPAGEIWTYASGLEPDVKLEGGK